MARTLPEVHARARSHHELGRIVGAAMAAQIKASFAADESLMAMLAHCECAAGAKLYAEFEEVNRRAYPHVLEEVAGIADGSGQPYKAVFLANIAQEFSTFVPKAAPIVGCTDVHVLTATESAWGHTEDVRGDVRGYIIHSTLLTASGDEDAPPIAAYTAFAYPGCVAGWAWGFNQAGVTFSINALTPNALRVGLAASFISRDVLDACSLDELHPAPPFRIDASRVLQHEDEA